MGFRFEVLVSQSWRFLRSKVVISLAPTTLLDNFLLREKRYSQAIYRIIEGHSSYSCTLGGLKDAAISRVHLDAFQSSELKLLHRGEARAVIL